MSVKKEKGSEHRQYGSENIEYHVAITIARNLVKILFFQTLTSVAYFVYVCICCNIFYSSTKFLTQANHSLIPFEWFGKFSAQSIVNLVINVNANSRLYLPYHIDIICLFDVGICLPLLTFWLCICELNCVNDYNNNSL